MAWTERGVGLFACATAMVVLAAIAVVLRFISRGYVLRRLGWTDCCIVITLLFSIANTVGVAMHITHGLGRHRTTITRDEVEGYRFWMYINIIIGGTSLLLTKISILLLFLDVFVINRARKVTYFFLTLVICYGIYLLTSNILFCIPISSFWELAASKDRCLSADAKYYADAVVNIALDFSIFCIPIPVVRAMTLPWRQKLWLYFVFTLGFFVCLVSCIRLHFLWYVNNSPDKPFEGTHMAYWSTIEMNVAIILACIPTLKPLMIKICPWVLNSIAAPNSSSQIPTLHCGRGSLGGVSPEPRNVGGVDPEMRMV
ncbi:hypothetical protein QBC41DRAFT_383685 [Cercophora samala]|uniref:Rhodopsin domain-containing protein n=1 Tax=Cercophora samala TaxID=330535 RepID=A0AA39YXQ2_9PEZI|nr:hypothetical protein QBC41DRAFT_383685 [Cercophora samala]